VNPQQGCSLQLLWRVPISPVLYWQSVSNFRQSEESKIGGNKFYEDRNARTRFYRDFGD
jgi:hypothetical protein